MTIRLGAVGYLNARPLVFGLDRSARFDLRFDVPAECARLLHGGEIDLGLIPSIEYLQDRSYRIVPDLAIGSRGPVASVALFATRPMRDVRTIVMDSSSKTSVALVRVLCARLFGIRPFIETMRPDLSAMLARGEAALMIGDKALLAETTAVEKIDLGEAWTTLTGLPFVWAFWAGRPDVLTPDDVRELQGARDRGESQSEAIAADYFREAPDHQAAGAGYLRDNIKYHLGDLEREGLERFYRYAVEAGVVPEADALRFYPA